jgi:hypothetical protein
MFSYIDVEREGLFKTQELFILLKQLLLYRIEVSTAFSGETD